jgi:sn-1 stearoyl-lipid 9-desaturase
VTTQPLGDSVLPGPQKVAVFVGPVYGCSKSDGIPYCPSLHEVLSEWIDAVNFVQNPTRKLAALSFAFHFATLWIFCLYCCFYANWKTFAFLVVSVYFLATIYNTMWYHRYCSHSSFEFESPAWSRLLLWTNPFFYREESYAIAHRIHHQCTDKVGDPYGPHLGWLGSYLAIESIQKVNPALTESEFDMLKKGLSHVGLHTNTYEGFQQTTSVEKLPAFLVRSLFEQLFWGAVIFAAGGPAYLMTWYGAIFVTFFLILSFNWHGHGGRVPRNKEAGWEFDNRSLALNQRFYGYLASEWHDNHHRYPMSANNGFLPGQWDFAFKIIQLLHKMGVVSRYSDATERFRRECTKALADTLPQSKCFVDDM